MKKAMIEDACAKIVPIALIFCMLLIFVPTSGFAANAQAPITITDGSAYTILDDSVIDVSSTTGYGILVGSPNGGTVTGEGLTINSQGGGIRAYQYYSNRPAQGDIVINLGKTVIDSKGSSTFGVAADAYNSIYKAEVNLGDGSIISSDSTASAIYATRGGLIKIGDNAIISGKSYSATAATVSAINGGRVEIGNDATIGNDGGTALVTGGNRIAVLAYDIGDSEGYVKIGDNSTIYSKGVGEGSSAVVTGHVNAVTAEITGGGTIVIGNGANISSQAIAVWSRHTDSSITIGDGSIISSDGASAVRSGYVHSTYAPGGGGGTITYTIGGGTITIGENALIKTNGSNSYGVDSRYADSLISVGQGASIITSGIGAAGVYAYDGGAVVLHGATISTKGSNAYGLYAATGKITGGNVDITTGGGSAAGILSSSSDIVLQEAKITTDGASASGLHATAAGTIKIEKTDITTNGFNAFGIYVTNNAKVELGSSTITTEDSYARAANIIGTNSTLTVRDAANWLTKGADATVLNVGSLMPGEGGISVSLGSGSVLRSEGNNAVAVHVSGSQTTGGENKVSLGAQTSLLTSGDNSHGIYVRHSTYTSTDTPTGVVTSYDHATPSVTLGESSKIETKGTAAHGVYMFGTDSVANIGANTSITTLGDNAHALFGHSYSTSSGTTTVTDTYYGKNGKINVSDGVALTTNGVGSHGAYVSGDTTSIEFTGGANITTNGEGSYALYAQAGKITSSQDQDGKVVSGGRFDISGDMRAEENGVIDLMMTNGSIFTGKTSYTGSGVWPELKLTLNGAATKWWITGDSALTDLYMDGATVDFRDSPEYTTLTVNRLNNSGISNTSGNFIMKANMATQLADMLLVSDPLGAFGSYKITVLNTGSAVTTGDEVVTLAQTGPGSMADFTLTKVVEQGGWQYNMKTANSSQSTSGASGGSSVYGTLWQLRATGEASGTGSGAINSFAGSYLMAYAETNTLIQRMGDLRDSEHLSGLWFRVHGGKFESNAKSYVRGFDMKYGGVQIGYDRKLENDWDGDLHLGAMFGYSKGDLDYSHEGSGEVDSKALGIYGVYVRPDGFYIDAVLKYQWMTNDFDVIDTAGTLVRGNEADTGGLGFSIEAGRRIPFSGNQKSGWYAEPQIQLSYQRQDGDYFNATNGLSIGVEPFTSILGRVGILVGYETEKANFYGKVSKVKEFDGDLTIRANGVPIEESFDGSWWVYGVGFTSRIDDRNSLHLDIERTSGGSFRQPWRINAGWRMEF